MTNTTGRAHWTERLEGLNPCEDALEWARTQPDPETAWRSCNRGDWMLWMLPRQISQADERSARLIACDIAETILHLVPHGEDRPRKAIETARLYANGTATMADLADLAAARAAAENAAWAAAGAADRAAARAAAGAAAGAADRAAARAEAWAAAWAADWAETTHIIRTYWPEPPDCIMARLRGLKGDQA